MSFCVKASATELRRDPQSHGMRQKMFIFRNMGDVAEQSRCSCSPGVKGVFALWVCGVGLCCPLPLSSAKPLFSRWRGHKAGRKRGNLSPSHILHRVDTSIGFPCPQGFDIINKGGIGPLTGELHPPVTHSFLPNPNRCSCNCNNSH